jgi:hypothetical protein
MDRPSGRGSKEDESEKLETEVYRQKTVEWNKAGQNTPRVVAPIEEEEEEEEEEEKEVDQWIINVKIGTKCKGKAAPVHTIKAYGGSAALVPLLLNHGTRWRREVTLDKRLRGPQSRSWCFWTQKRVLPLLGIEALFLARAVRIVDIIGRSYLSYWERAVVAYFTFFLVNFPESTEGKQKEIVRTEIWSLDFLHGKENSRMNVTAMLITTSLSYVTVLLLHITTATG